MSDINDCVLSRCIYTDGQVCLSLSWSSAASSNRVALVFLCCSGAGSSVEVIFLPIVDYI